jgi:hypothetical protein
MNLNIYNFFSDSDVLFFGIFIGVGCHLTYSLAKTVYGNYFYVDKEVQTDA